MVAEAATNLRVAPRVRASGVDRVALVLWLAALWISAVSFASADWADHLGLVPVSALLSALLGLALARSRFSGRASLLLAFAYGLFFIGWSLARTLEPSLSWLERTADLTGRLGAFLLTVAKGEPSRDPLMFVQLIAWLYWGLGAYGSWILFRGRGYWAAVLIPGIALAVNMHLYRGGLNLSHYVPIYLVLALSLALRTEMIQRRDLWARWKALVPSDASYQIARAGLVAVFLLVGVAWLLPGFAAYEQVSAAWNDPRGLVGGLRDLISDAFGGLRYPVTVVSETFGNSLELGAGRLPPERPMFVAQPARPLPAAARVYWRARVLDTYDGGTWTAGPTTIESFDPGAGVIASPAYAGRIEVEFALTAQVSALHLLYVPAQPRWLNREAELTTLAAGPGGLDVLEVTARRFVLEGETYRALGSLALPAASALRAAGQDYPAWVAERYLQLPDGLPVGIGDMAETIAGDEATAYDRAAAVTAWLRANITYRRDSDAPPDGIDPIEWFLFESRTGFCDYYASAEVLMLRSLGIPSRLALGFAEGEYDEEHNAFYVSAIDSHAWPEVFFPGYGWVEFEPTRSQPALIRLEDRPGVGSAVPDEPGADLGDPASGGAGIPGEDPLFSPFGDVEDVGLAEAQNPIRRWGWAAFVVAVVAVAAAAAVLRSRSLRFAGEAEGDSGIGASARSWSWWMATPSRRTYRSLVRWSRWLGVSPGRTATPAEHAAALESSLPALRGEAVAVAEAYAGERYGSRTVEPRGLEEAWIRQRLRLARAWLARRAFPFLTSVVRGVERKPPASR